MADKEIDANFPKNQETPGRFQTESADSSLMPESEEAAPGQAEEGAERREPVGATTTADFFGVLKRKRPRVAIPQPNDAVTAKIEKILEDGVGEAYSRLSPIARQEFKLKGEATAFKIRELLKSGHAEVKKIFRLILEWLKMLPGINRFFLEQEAKIKTDRILSLHKQTIEPNR